MSEKVIDNHSWLFSCWFYVRHNSFLLQPSFFKASKLVFLVLTSNVNPDNKEHFELLKKYGYI